MEAFIIREVSTSGEVIDREMTETEQEELQLSAARNQEKFAEIETALQRKMEIYSRLGLTADEVAALLA